MRVNFKNIIEGNFDDKVYLSGRFLCDNYCEDYVFISNLKVI